MKISEIHVKHKTGPGSPSKPPNINMQLIRTEINKKQGTEKEFKGTLNSELYLYALDVDDNIIMYGPWLKMKVPFLRSFINSTTYVDVITRVIVSNQYMDWELEVYEKT